MIINTLFFFQGRGCDVFGKILLSILTNSNLFFCTKVSRYHFMCLFCLRISYHPDPTYGAAST